jgi:hypothetical protein
MRGAQVDPPLGVSFNPPAKDPAAWKTGHMRAARIDNRQFQIAVERRG